MKAATSAFLVDATYGRRDSGDSGTIARSYPGDAVQNLDATLIEDSLRHAALCADCIGRITGVPSSRLNDVLPRLIGALRVASILAACRNCLRETVVHRRE
jgi:hypothetical protein